MLMEDSQMSYGDLNMRCNYDFMGQIWCARGEYAFALSWYEKSLDSLQSVNTYREVILSHIGNVHDERGEKSLALKYCNEALIHKETMDLLDLASLCEQFSDLYRKMGHIDESLIYLCKALDIYIYNKHQFSHFNYGNIYLLIAAIFSVRIDYQKALSFQKCALSVPSQLVPKNYARSALRYRQKDLDFPEEPLYQIAKILATNAELNSTKVDLNLLATVTHRIASVYELANRYEEAYYFAEAELRIQCNDSNPNFEIVASTHEWFARLCPNE
ncbi:unnamed protein product [Rotaria magnacalcarata]